MKAPGHGVCMVCAAIAVLLALPAFAAAKPGFEVQDRGLRLGLIARAENGYLLWVSTEGHRKVTLTAFKGSVYAIYRTAGRITRNRIEADFGKLGKISVRFDGVRRPFELFPGFDLPPRSHRECRGRRPVREVGSFHGAIRFEGEQGFTRLEASRARGEVRRFSRRVCRREQGPPGSADSGFGGGRANLLLVGDRTRRRSVSFEILNFDFGPGLRDLESALGTFALAAISETREGMKIYRAASAYGDEGSLMLSPRGATPETATIALPKPFGGTAEYRKQPGTPASWYGSLRAWLPGAGMTPLTGAGFSATLCRVRLAELLPSNRCLRRSEVPLPGRFATGPAIGRQLSGSQSQAFGDARLSWSR